MAKVTLDMETFKALASQTRLDVLRALDERRKTLSELAKQLELNKATVHEHLQLLLATGLIKKHDEGRKWIYYELTWSGERLLHPEDTTTFAILLGLSTAAAGGGVAMLGRALHWWWTDRQLQGAPEGGAADDTLRDVDDSPSPSAAQDASTGSSGSQTGTQSSTQSGTQTSTQTGTQTGTQSTGQQGGAQASPEGGDALRESSTTGDAELSMEGGGFFDDGGWIALALFTTALLLLALAYVVRGRRRRAKA